MALVRLTHSEMIGINLRLPLHVKNEMTALRKLAEKHDVDFTATFSERIEQALTDIRTEIEALDRKSTPHGNGAVHKTDA